MAGSTCLYKVLKCVFIKGPYKCTEKAEIILCVCVCKTGSNSHT